jgi:hypothetical protein
LLLDVQQFKYFDVFVLFGVPNYFLKQLQSMLLPSISLLL